MENLLQKLRVLFSSPTHSRTLAVLALLIVVSAIPLTVFIAQKQQEIRQRASTTGGDGGGGYGGGGGGVCVGAGCEPTQPPAGGGVCAGAVCNDDYSYCDNGRWIHKTGGYCENGDCQYAYNDEGPCGEGGGVCVGVGCGPTPTPGGGVCVGVGCPTCDEDNVYCDNGTEYHKTGGYWDGTQCQYAYVNTGNPCSGACVPCSQSDQVCIGQQYTSTCDNTTTCSGTRQCTTGNCDEDYEYCETSVNTIYHKTGGRWDSATNQCDYAYVNTGRSCGLGIGGGGIGTTPTPTTASGGGICTNDSECSGGTACRPAACNPQYAGQGCGFFNMPAGSSCGSGQTCDGNGNCVSNGGDGGGGGGGNLTLSGQVTNASTGQGIANVVINQGVANADNGKACYIGTATTGSDGRFSFSVPSGQIFCMRAPALSGYTLSAGGYECQRVGGLFNPDACNNSTGGSIDVAADNAYNFAYTPVQTAQSPTPTSVAASTPTVTPVQGVTSTPTITTSPAPGDKILALELYLKGVGSDIGENQEPKTTTRTVTVELFNAGNQKLGDKTGNVTYDATSKTFKGTINGGNVPAGNYSLKVKADKYLRKVIAGIVQVTQGATTVNAPKTTLLVGDITGDNKINIQDYNQWRSCINKKVEGSCVNTDLNDDGSNDTEANPKLGTQDILPDFKLLKQSFQTKEGD